MNKEMDSNVKELRRIGELYACKEALRNELDDLAFEEREDLEAQKIINKHLILSLVWL